LASSLQLLFKLLVDHRSIRQSIIPLIIASDKRLGGVFVPIKVRAKYVRISSVDAIIGDGNRGKVLHAGLRYALGDQLDGPLR